MDRRERIKYIYKTMSQRNFFFGDLVLNWFYDKNSYFEIITLFKIFLFILQNPKIRYITSVLNWCYIKVILSIHDNTYVKQFYCST